MQNPNVQVYGYAPQPQVYAPQQQAYAPAPYYPPGQTPPATQHMNQHMNQPMMVSQMNQPMMVSQMNHPQLIVVANHSTPIIAHASDPFPKKMISDEVRNPQNLTCVHCDAKMTTLINKEWGCRGWSKCLMICVFCFIYFWVAFFMDSSYNYVHSCPNCKLIVSFSF